jgi:hypothetical protein
VQDREGLADPAELHLVGSWERVLDGLAACGAAGATDLRLEVAAPDEASREPTREALAAHLARASGRASGVRWRGVCADHPAARGRRPQPAAVPSDGRV